MFINDDIAVKVENLSKMYKVYKKPADMFWEMVSRKKRHTEFWALKDINLTVRRGEVLGIIGRNGAGKSTLLKILAGTLDKTTGSIEVNGKISAILELGTGFHMEYTGRQNIYMGGLCIGMSLDEINSKIDSIIEFSELGGVIDQPFKTYSSGMQARLTFATAVSVDPSIFIVDEALAAGDILFQEKCYKRIKEIVDTGTTVLFVTHSLPAIYELCSRAILLAEGRMLMDGDPREVGDAYELLLARERDKTSSKKSAAENVKQKVHHSGAALIDSIAIYNKEGTSVTTLEFREWYTVEVKVACNEDCDLLSVGMMIQNPFGSKIYNKNTWSDRIPLQGRAGQTLVVRFRFQNLIADGNYLLGAGLGRGHKDGSFEQLHILRGEIPITTIGSSSCFRGQFDLQAEIDHCLLDSEQDDGATIDTPDDQKEEERDARPEPAFIGVGAAKSGTTWWFDLICSHPEVVRPQGEIKQASFFNRFRDEIPEQELEAYRALFHAEDGKVSGEWTPSYMYDKHSIDLIARYFPGAKLIVLLRNPIDRFVSGLNWHLVSSGPIKVESLEEYLASDYCHWWPHNYGDALARSLYWYQLQRIAQLFDRDQVLVLQMEKCMADTTSELKRTYKFLELNDDYLPQSVDIKAKNNVSRYVHRALEDPQQRACLARLLWDDTLKLARDWPEIDISYWPDFAE